jgi:NAD-dependent deacetylase
MSDLQRRIDAGEIDPRCDACGGLLKAATILFGQRVPDAELARAKEMTAASDLFLVVGSSLKVIPAATLPRLALNRNIPLIIINLQPTTLDPAADVVIHEKAGEVLPGIIEQL